MAGDPAKIADEKRDFEVRETIVVAPGASATRKFSFESKWTDSYTHSFGHTPSLVIDAEGMEHTRNLAEDEEVCPGVRIGKNALDSDYAGKQFHDATTAVVVHHDACPVRVLVCFHSRYSAGSFDRRSEEYYYLDFKRAEASRES